MPKCRALFATLRTQTGHAGRNASAELATRARLRGRTINRQVSAAPFHAILRTPTRNPDPRVLVVIDSKERSPGKIINQQARVLLHRAPSQTPTSNQVPHASARHHLLEPSVGKAPSLR